MCDNSTSEVKIIDSSVVSEWIQKGYNSNYPFDGNDKVLKLVQPNVSSPLLAISELNQFDDFRIDGNEMTFYVEDPEDYAIFYSKDEGIQNHETFSIKIKKFRGYTEDVKVDDLKTSEYGHGRNLAMLRAKLLKQACPSSDVYFVDVEINELASRFPILFRENQLYYDTAFQMHRSILEKIEPKEVYPGLWICPNSEAILSHPNAIIIDVEYDNNFPGYNSNKCVRTVLSENHEKWTIGQFFRRGSGFRESKFENFESIEEKLKSGRNILIRGDAAIFLALPTVFFLDGYSEAITWSKSSKYSALEDAFFKICESIEEKFPTWISCTRSSWDWGHVLGYHSHGVFPAKILPRLYLGSEAHAKSPKIRGKTSITHILALGFFGYLRQEKSENVTFMKIGLDDGLQSMYPYFEQIYEFLDGALSSPDSRVLVHCQAGISRSSTAVISYLMKKERIPYFKALALVKSKRFCIDPHPIFVKDLIRLEKEIFGKYVSYPFGLTKHIRDYYHVYDNLNISNVAQNE